MQIIVKTLTGRKQTFDFELGTKVKAVKEQLQEKEGIDINQIRLVFSGQQLQDDKTLEESKVEPGGTIHMVLSLRGGYA